MTDVKMAIRLMDLLKKRILMVEYLGKPLELELIKPMPPAENWEDFFAELRGFIDHVESLIPDAVLDYLDGEDYAVYTHDNHGRKFWNEIELHDEVEKHFEAFINILGLKQKTSSEYAVCLYDLAPGTLYFDTEEEMEKMLKKEDLTPYTAFKINGDVFIELYSA